MKEKKEMQVNDITQEIFKEPDLSNVVFKDDDGEVADGQRIVIIDSSPCLLLFENGILTDGPGAMGSTIPAVEGAGFMEHRTNGILTNPNIDYLPEENCAARICEGFNKREYWENGKLVRVTEKSYDKDDNPVWS